MELVANLLSLIIGLLVGYYANTIHRYVSHTFEEKKYQHDAKKAGVIKPEVTPVTRGRVINLKASKSGVIPRMSPDEILIHRAKEREERLKHGT